MRILILVIALFFLTTSATNAQVLDFSTNNLKLNEGETSSVSISLDPQKLDVVGADLFLNFDKKYLEVVDIVSTGAFSQSAGKKIDNSNGKIQFAVFADRGSSLNNKKDIATILLKAKRTGSTFVSFEFKEGSTVDTNVTSKEGKDVLAKTNNLKLTLSAKNTSNSQADNANPNTAEAAQTSASPTGEVQGSSEKSIIEKVKDFVLGENDEMDTVESSIQQEAGESVQPPAKIINSEYIPISDTQNSFLNKNLLFAFIGLGVGISSTLLVTKLKEK